MPAFALPGDSPLLRTTLEGCRDRFRELGKSVRLRCVARVLDPVEPGKDREPPLPSRGGMKVSGSFNGRHYLDVFGLRNTWQDFERVAIEAFRCIEGCSDPIRQFALENDLPEFCGSEAHAFRWIHILLRLALRKIPGSPLRADQMAWKGQMVQKMSELSVLRERFAGKTYGGIDINSLPTGELWYIELDDLANSASAAIEICLSSMAPDTKMPLKEPPEVAASTTEAGEPKGPAKQPKISDVLMPCETKAYSLFQYAEDQTERRLQDREAYDWLNENGWPEGLFAGASDYELPTFDTWAKHVRVARNAHGTSKRRRRAPSTTTRSVIRQQDLDSPRDD